MLHVYIQMKYKEMLQKCENELMKMNDRNALKPAKVSVSERGLNNDKSTTACLSPPDKNQHINWFITKNEIEGILEKDSELKERVERISKKYVFQYERGKVEKTLHYHLLIVLKKRARFSSLKELFGKCVIKHVSKKDLMKVRDYCCKEDTRIGNPVFKWPGLKYTDTSYLIQKEDLKARQVAIVDRYITDEDSKWGRKIHWYWESKGGWGKTTMAKYLIDNAGAMMVQGGSKNILCGVAKWIEKNGEAPRIILIDIPRYSYNKVSYNAIESIKNGAFFSGKYESGMERFKIPHILVFANAAPDEEKLSQDRWVIEELALPAESK